MLAIRLSERTDVTAATVHTANHLVCVREQLAPDYISWPRCLRDGVRSASALVLAGWDRA
jgi:hypothetical protein